MVSAYGITPLLLDEHAPMRGWVDPQKVPMRGVLVRQQVWQQTAKLLGYSGDRPGVSVLPEMKLRGALMVEVVGVSRPVTLCGHAKDLDPSPCISIQDVRLDNAAAYLDQGSAFHFVEHVAMRDAVNLAQMRDRFVLPVSVGGQQLCAFDWRLYYPDDLVFTGREPGTGDSAGEGAFSECSRRGERRRCRNNRLAGRRHRCACRGGSSARARYDTARRTPCS